MFSLICALNKRLSKQPLDAIEPIMTLIQYYVLNKRIYDIHFVIKMSLK